MTTGRRGFWESEDAYVRRAADEAISTAASADARLSGQIRTTEGRLNALAVRLDGLARAFDAFVEASEVRREVERYGAAAAVRAYVRAHFGVLTSPVAALPSTVGVSDVPGYWLPPAVLGLVELLGGGAHREVLAEAGRRDAQRTAVFLVAVLGERGAGDEAAPWLEAALPPLGEGSEVTLAARTLWLAYGAGVYGPAGQAVLGQWLRGLASTVETDDLERALAGFGGRSGLSFTPAENPRLRNLRSQSIEDSLRGAAAASDGLVTLHGALSGELRLQDAASFLASGPDPTPETLLTALVEEGSPPEADLLRKAADLEARARRSAQRESPRSWAWDAGLGQAAEFLLADLFDVGEAAAARRLAALTALARPLAAVADALLARTGTLPTTLSVPIPWQDHVTLDSAVPFDQTVAAVHADIERAIAAESPGAGRKQQEVNRRRADEQKQTATDRLRDAADILAAYRRQGEEIHTAAKTAYTGVMSLLGSHVEGMA